MPRRARLRIADIPLHIIQRGNNRAACFYNDDDCLFYPHHLGEFGRKFECAIHVYALMTNHVHLLLSPRKAAGASLLMKHLGQRYVQYVNKTYRRSGTLWEGRFRSSLVQVQDYLLRCYRYIELNPVRANMVEHPAGYRWSSHSVNAAGKQSTLITPHAEYLALGTDGPIRRQRYADLFRTEIDEVELKDIRVAVNGGYAFGGERFKTEIAAALGRRVAPAVGGRPAGGGGYDEKQQELSL